MLFAAQQALLKLSASLRVLQIRGLGAKEAVILTRGSQNKRYTQIQLTGMGALNSGMTRVDGFI